MFILICYTTIPESVGERHYLSYNQSIKGNKAYSSNSLLVHVQAGRCQVQSESHEPACRNDFNQVSSLKSFKVSIYG